MEPSSAARFENGEQILEAIRGYQIPCIIAAAVDLDVFQMLADGPKTADELANQATYDLRGLTILLDALAAIGLLEKQETQYSLLRHLMPFLLDGTPESVTAMLRHQANCLRSWSRLPWTVVSGIPQDPGPSIRGVEADQASFIEAMHVVSRSVCENLVREIHPGGFRCVMDLGGGSGSWTLAWLAVEPGAKAILFDLPHVIPMARKRLSEEGVAERVTLVEGDFYTDPLPQGADLVWVSAIIHQNSAEQNRELYRRIAEAIEPDGWIYIRDIVMEPSRTRPIAGALFAVNMLSATPKGNTYTLDEIKGDLESAGFTGVELIRRDPGMHSIVRARAGKL